MLLGRRNLGCWSGTPKQLGTGDCSSGTNVLRILVTLSDRGSIFSRSLIRVFMVESIDWHIVEVIISLAFVTISALYFRFMESVRSPIFVICVVTKPLRSSQLGILRKGTRNWFFWRSKRAAIESCLAEATKFPETGTPVHRTLI
jgi:hypothetical protein